MTTRFPNLPTVANADAARRPLTQQLTVAVPLPTYVKIRNEAARKGVTMKDLCLSWMEPHLRKLET